MEAVDSDMLQDYKVVVHDIPAVVVRIRVVAVLFLVVEQTLAVAVDRVTVRNSSVDLDL